MPHPHYFCVTAIFDYYQGFVFPYCHLSCVVLHFENKNLTRNSYYPFPSEPPPMIQRSGVLSPVWTLPLRDEHQSGLEPYHRAYFQR